MKQAGVTSIFIAVVLLAAGVIAGAQQTGKVHRIGYLSAASAESDKNRFAAFQRRMQELGYSEGKNIVIEQRYAPGQSEKIPEMLGELLRLKIDVLVVYGDVAIRAAKNATTTHPHCHDGPS